MRKQYPNRAEEYQLLEQIGNGATAIVHRALCAPFDEIVAIKIVDLERSNGDLVNDLMHLGISLYLAFPFFLFNLSVTFSV